MTQTRSAKGIFRGSSFLRVAAIVLLSIAIVPATLAQTYTVLSTFDTSGLALLSFQGSDGDFYGLDEGAIDTNYACGLSQGPSPCGSVLKLTAGGTLTRLYGFSYATGGLPGFLRQGTDGNYYGLTTTGGTGAGCYDDTGCGTVFSVTPEGNFTALYNSSIPGDGRLTSLVEGSDGNLYGTSEFGGSSNSSMCLFIGVPQGCGTFFQITTAGTLTVLYSFCSQANCSDGYFPGGLMAGTDGNFYGLAEGGANGGGTFFQLTPQGLLTTVYNFPAPGPAAVGGSQSFYSDMPTRRKFAKLIPGNRLKENQSGPAGATGKNPGSLQVFYGSSLSGGTNNEGLVFQVTSAGSYNVLYNFCSQPNCADGARPNAAVLASDGNLYGTTYQGGMGAYCQPGSGCGTIFELTPSGQLTTLYNFCSQPNCADGQQTYSGLLLMQSADTVFYGIAFLPGGSPNSALFYSLSNGLNGNSPSATGLDLSSSSVTAGSNASVTLTATVAPGSGGGTPIGTVAFANGSTYIGTAPLVAGVGTYSYDAGGLAVGGYQIAAAYSGDATHAVSTSSAQSLTVNPAPVADFQFTASSSALTLGAGQSANTTLTVAPENGFNSQVSFSCSGLPSGVTCGFNPASVTPNGNGAATTALTISATASAASRAPSASSPRWTYALLLPCVGLIFLW
jgi:uncharacterized repeat protein (TIGR03803 family)